LNTMTSPEQVDWAEEARLIAEITACSQQEDRLEEARARYQLGRLQARRLQKWPDAEQNLARSAELYRQVGNSLGQAEALCDLGTLYFILGQDAHLAKSIQQAARYFSDAYRCYEKALALVPPSDSEQLVHIRATCTMHMAIIKNLTRPASRNAEEAETALGNTVELLEAALRDFKELRNDRGQCEALNNLATIYVQRADHEKASHLAEEALEIATEIGDGFNQTYALTTRAEAEVAKGQYESAWKSYREARQIPLEEIDPPLIRMWDILLGELIDRPRKYEDPMLAARRVAELRQERQELREEFHWVFEIPVGEEMMEERLAMAIQEFQRPQIFLCYAQEDEEKVESLYKKLLDADFKPWMAKKDILPGETWESSIPRAIRRCDFFMACLSTHSVTKRGFLQKEIRYALDMWKEKLEDDIYLIPVRLEDCTVPEKLCAFQWVNLFEDDDWARLLRAIQVGIERRMQ
jgi:tetratricopeptide (TPR) repeat protein